MSSYRSSEAYRQKAKERAAAWQAANPEKAAAIRAKPENRAKACARAKAWREADPEGCRARKRAAYATQRDTIRARNAASYVRNREKRLAYAKAVREADPQRADLSMAKRELSRSTGIRIRDIPNDLAALKVAELVLKREIKAAQEASA